MDTASRPGQALAATLEEPGFYAGDPFPHYARLRREAPLAWNAELGYWAVSKHADVVAISRDPETFCSGKGILTFEIGVEYPSPPTMMHTDPPDHTRYRKLVQPGFAPSRMRALATRVRARADELVARVEPGERVRRGRDARGAVPALDHRRAARHPRVGLAALLPVVGSLDPGRDRLAARGVPRGCRPRCTSTSSTTTKARRGDPRATTSSRCSPRPRSTASRCATTSS